MYEIAYVIIAVLIIIIMFMGVRLWMYESQIKHIKDELAMLSSANNETKQKQEKNVCFFIKISLHLYSIEYIKYEKMSSINEIKILIYNKKINLSKH